MAMGRGSCTVIVVTTLLLLICSPLQSLAETHVVGDSQGWGFSVSYDSWVSDKAFAAGDTLVFNYQPALHNVVPVSAAEYRRCKASTTTKAVTTGSDKFALKKGTNYFICSLPGHCTAGMKILVVAN